jgi:lysophospholipase L1-like esterase
MLASHRVSQAKGPEEFRVLVIGDSGTWGWFLEPADTLAGQLNEAGLRTADGRSVVAYNLGYPIMALSKDLMLLDAALAAEPDLIIWPVTQQSFPREQQLVPPLVQENPERLRRLIEEFDIKLDPDDERFADPDLLAKSIVGQRRALADLIRLQLYGFSWAATGIDQAIPEEIPLRKSDFEEDLSWGEIESPRVLDESSLAFDVLAAGVTRAGEVPLLIVNEPIFISDGRNSDLRYNAWYPRWAYDQYRELLGQRAAAEGWTYLDLWQAIDPSEFTDSPVHLTPEGMAQLADILAPVLEDLANRDQ